MITALELDIYDAQLFCLTGSRNGHSRQLQFQLYATPWKQGRMP